MFGKLFRKVLAKEEDQYCPTKEVCLKLLTDNSAPTGIICVAYDPVQQIIAVGTRDGKIFIYGGKGISVCLYAHPTNLQIKKLICPPNEGKLIGYCEVGSESYLLFWSLKELKLLFQVRLRHRLRLIKLEPPYLMVVFENEPGDLRFLHYRKLSLSKYTFSMKSNIVDLELVDRHLLLSTAWGIHSYDLNKSTDGMHVPLSEKELSNVVSASWIDHTKGVFVYFTSDQRVYTSRFKKSSSPHSIEFLHNYCLQNKSRISCLRTLGESRFCVCIERIIETNPSPKKTPQPKKDSSSNTTIPQETFIGGFIYQIQNGKPVCTSQHSFSNLGMTECIPMRHAGGLQQTHYLGFITEKKLQFHLLHLTKPSYCSFLNQFGTGQKKTQFIKKVFVFENQEVADRGFEKETKYDLLKPEKSWPLQGGTLPSLKTRGMADLVVVWNKLGPDMDIVSVFQNVTVLGRVRQLGQLFNSQRMAGSSLIDVVKYSSDCFVIVMKEESLEMMKENNHNNNNNNDNDNIGEEGRGGGGGEGSVKNKPNKPLPGRPVKNEVPPETTATPPPVLPGKETTIPSSININNNNNNKHPPHLKISDNNKNNKNNNHTATMTMMTTTPQITPPPSQILFTPPEDPRSVIILSFYSTHDPLKSVVREVMFPQFLHHKLKLVYPAKILQSLIFVFIGGYIVLYDLSKTKITIQFRIRLEENESVTTVSLGRVSGPYFNHIQQQKKNVNNTLLVMIIATSFGSLYFHDVCTGREVFQKTNHSTFIKKEKFASFPRKYTPIVFEALDEKGRMISSSIHDSNGTPEIPDFIADEMKKTMDENKTGKEKKKKKNIVLPDLILLNRRSSTSSINNNNNNNSEEEDEEEKRRRGIGLFQYPGFMLEIGFQETYGMTFGPFDFTFYQDGVVSQGRNKKAANGKDDQKQKRQQQLLREKQLLFRFRLNSLDMKVGVFDLVSQKYVERTMKKSSFDSTPIGIERLYMTYSTQNQMFRVFNERGTEQFFLDLSQETVGLNVALSLRNVKVTCLSIPSHYLRKFSSGEEYSREYIKEVNLLVFKEYFPKSVPDLLKRRKRELNEYYVDVEMKKRMHWVTGRYDFDISASNTTKSSIATASKNNNTVIHLVIGNASMCGVFELTFPNKIGKRVAVKRTGKIGSEWKRRNVRVLSAEISPSYPEIITLDSSGEIMIIRLVPEMGIMYERKLRSRFINTDYDIKRQQQQQQLQKVNIDSTKNDDNNNNSQQQKQNGLDEEKKKKMMMPWKNDKEEEEEGEEDDSLRIVGLGAHKIRVSRDGRRLICVGRDTFAEFGILRKDDSNKLKDGNDKLFVNLGRAARSELSKNRLFNNESVKKLKNSNNNDQQNQGDSSDNGSGRNDNSNYSMLDQFEIVKPCFYRSDVKNPQQDGTIRKFLKGWFSKKDFFTENEHFLSDRDPMQKELMTWKDMRKERKRAIILGNLKNMKKKSPQQEIGKKEKKEEEEETEGEGDDDDVKKKKKKMEEEEDGLDPELWKDLKDDMESKKMTRVVRFEEEFGTKKEREKSRMRRRKKMRKKKNNSGDEGGDPDAVMGRAVGELNDTMEIMKLNKQKLIERGEKLSRMAEKSNELKDLTKHYYQNTLRMEKRMKKSWFFI